MKRIPNQIPNQIPKPNTKLIALALAAISLAASLAAPLAAQMSMPSASAQASPMPAKPTVKPSTSLTVYATFDGKPVTFTPADLLALPQQTITAVDGHTNKSVTFTGPLVTDVLAKAGLVPSEKTHKLILNSYVSATGTDGYRVIYSLAELEPMFTSGHVIIALTQDGKPSDSGLQLINPLDVKPARWVHGITKIVIDQVHQAN